MKKKIFLSLAASALLVLGVGTASANASAKKFSYYTSNPSIVETKRNVEMYKNANRTRKAYGLDSDEYVHTSGIDNAHHDLVTHGNRYLTSNKAYVKASKGYQNPKRYYQVQYKQIKGAKHIPSIGIGWEGMRTYKFTHKYGLPDGHNYFTYGDAYFVRNFQRRHHLPVTGRINYKTWRKMGFSDYQWNHLDNAVPKESFKPWQGRSAHINAGIRRIKKYLGGIWISGTSSSPEYKKADCSGLAMQYLMGGGLYDTHSGNPMLHAEPGNEWDSRKMFRDPRLKRVPFSDRERGDLIFFAPSAGGTVWHVGVMTSRNTMIDSWPPVVEYHSIFNGEHGAIVGVKRPFL